MNINIIGAGLAGCTCAALLKRDHHIVLYEKLRHIGGMCYDGYIGNTMVHQHGPHYFHTNDKEVWNFIQDYCSMSDIRCRTVVDTFKYKPFPIPFNDISANIVGHEPDLVELIFKDYSFKQWGKEYWHLPDIITSRVPIRRQGTNCDYFLDAYQGIPRDSYTSMMEDMAYGCHKVFESNKTYRKCDLTIWTGSIDEYFLFKYGHLEYRTVVHDHQYSEVISRHNVVNYPSLDVLYTRTYDNSKFSTKKTKETVISYEYPEEYNGIGFPAYPKNWGRNQRLFETYNKIPHSNIIFVGRLATYQYLNMDQTIRQCIDICKKIS